MTLVPTVYVAATNTPMLDGDVFARVRQVVAVPNPNPTGLSVYIQGRARKLRLQIFGVSLRLLVDETLGPQGPGWVSVALPPEILGSASNGTYYVRAWTEDLHQAVIARFVLVR